jgi:hypothetical protein
MPCRKAEQRFWPAANDYQRIDLSSMGSPNLKIQPAKTASFVAWPRSIVAIPWPGGERVKELPGEMF